MKKIIIGFILGLISAAAVSYALVQVQTVSSTQYRFDLETGTRVVVLKKGYTGTFRVTAGKDFDFTIPANKTMSGVLLLK